MNTSKTIFFASSNELTKIDVEDLKVGMYVASLDRPWLETTFLYQGFELKNQADINAVSQQCKFVYINIAKQGKSETFQLQPLSDTKVNLNSPCLYKKTSSFTKEINHAGYVYKEASDLIKNFMEDMYLDRTFSVKMAKKAVANCVNSVLNAPDALLWMTQLKNRDLYTSQHSMNVCILAITLGRQINLTTDQLNIVGLCGMMHDMGKMRVPLDILNKPGKLEDGELKIMQSHAEIGWQLLSESSEMSREAIDVAHSHHEHVDGTGYPRGLSGEKISLYTRIVAIVDMYDAITSDRVYQKGRTHIDAISIMTKLCDTHLDADLTYKFIECLGIYPPGSLVEMTNGEIAIIVEANPTRLKPKVLLLLNEHKQPQEERMVDLSKVNADNTGQPYKILKTIRSDEVGIDLNVYYHNGVIAKGLASM